MCIKEEKKIYSPKKWGELSFKDKLAYLAAMFSLMMSWVIVIMGILTPPPGEVHTSVLSVLGITMMFVASIFGIAFYMKGSKAEVYNDVLDKVDKYIERKREEEK